MALPPVPLARDGRPCPVGPAMFAAGGAFPVFNKDWPCIVPIRALPRYP